MPHKSEQIWIACSRVPRRLKDSKASEIGLNFELKSLRPSDQDKSHELHLPDFITRFGMCSSRLQAGTFGIERMPA